MERDEVANASNSLMSNCVTRAGGPKGGRIEKLSKLRPLAQPHIQCHDVRHGNSRTTLISDNFKALRKMSLWTS